jgi:cytochrome b subunit of formate dehydrogenase
MIKKTAIIFILILLFIPASFLYADDETCDACHDDSDLTRIEGGIPISLYANTAMIAGSVHDGLECIDCHMALDGIDDFPHETNIAGVNCAECHSDAFDEYMTGFREHLVTRGYSDIPNCTQCHGKHEISHKTDTRLVCGICHNDKRLAFEKSVHFNDDSPDGLSCTSCHSAHDKTERGLMLAEDWRIDMVNQCEGCHDNQSANYLNSHHYNEVVSGNLNAPICIDCHGDHEIHKVDDPQSPVHVDHLDKTCDRCHAGHNASIHRKSDVDPRLMTCVACHTGHVTDMNRVESAIFKETVPETCDRCHGDDRHQKENLAHGKIMMLDEDGETSNCTSCHVYHWNANDSEVEKAKQKRLACINCHVKENQDYENSAHGVAFRKGHTEAPTCITCHGDSEVERISSSFSGQSITSLCGSCHGNSEITMKFQLNPTVVEGYLSTYHGQSYSLGYQGKEFATCVSCHDNHLILPSDNPESTISSAHIVETCGRCHEDANENFVSMLQHYDPMAHDENPMLGGIHTFMIYLLGITLSIFGIHTLLWFGRATFDRIKRGPGKKPTSTPSDVRYRRFSRFPRFKHALVITSFLLLAMTGLPLKYHHTPLAQWIAGNLLDLRTMAILHRVGAGITLLYFVLHLGYLTYAIVAKKKSLKYMFWGSNSMVPQPRDAIDFVQHIGYFLGLAKRPLFGRWTYWEKFDYFAVFWGVAIIGVSGLTLWFPEFFTQIFPGWAINAAHIIHSEEALLATGFIFTIHFFNVHLRPETFPFDEVIFTGRMNEHQLKEERPLWYKELKESGELEKIEVKKMGLWVRVILYGIGFSALGIGLTLLGMIIAGSFF